METGKVLLGVLAGAAAGALLGVLLAPNKGSDTRKKITDKSDEILEDFKEKFESIVSSITEKFDLAKEDASQFAGKVKSKTEDFRKDGKVETAQAM
jgi:gas vesicle protein